MNDAHQEGTYEKDAVNSWKRFREPTQQKRVERIGFREEQKEDKRRDVKKDEFASIHE